MNRIETVPDHYGTVFGSSWEVTTRIGNAGNDWLNAISNDTSSRLSKQAGRLRAGIAARELPALVRCVIAPVAFRLGAKPTS